MLIMTCIAAVAEKGRVWVLGDHQIDCGQNTFPKAWADSTRKWCFGWSGKGRLGQIIQHHLVLPDKDPPSKDLHIFLGQEFVPRLRVTLKEQGGLTRVNEVEEMDGFLLVGVGGRIFALDHAFY